ncbi:MAG: hypothetical protein AB7J97_10395 [Steroidobacteraceae bacterium]
MVIGIGLPEKERPGEGRGFFRAVRPADEANCSQRLLRRCGFFSSSGSGITGSSSGVAGSSSGITRGSGGIAGSSSGIGGGISSRHHFFCRSGSLFSRSFFLGTGTQDEGNRNGAPDLCIHRQLPQFVQ